MVAWGRAVGWRPFEVRSCCEDGIASGCGEQSVELKKRVLARLVAAICGAGFGKRLLRISSIFSQQQ